MFVEAAAQSSAAFNRDEDVKVGFLSMSKNVRALEDITEKEYVFKLNKEAEIHNYRQFRFQAFTLKNSTLIVTGKFTLVLEQ